MPLTLRGVTTPINNPHLFKEQQRLLRDRKLAAMGRAPAQSSKGMMKPGRKSPFKTAGALELIEQRGLRWP